MDINTSYSSYTNSLYSTQSQSSRLASNFFEVDSTDDGTSSVSSSQSSDAVIQKYDTDGDGKLSASELAEMLKSMSPPPKPKGGEVDGEPPEEPLDVSEMTDDELVSMLSSMINQNGSLPEELSAYNDADLENLSEEDLSSIRSIMEDMQTQFGHKPQGPPPSNAYEISDDALTSMLTEMKSENGRLPIELSAYNDYDLENLSDDVLSNIRAIMESTQETKNSTMSSARQNFLYSQAIVQYSNFFGWDAS